MRSFTQSPLKGHGASRPPRTRTAASGKERGERPFLYLQGVIGNQAVQQLLRAEADERAAGSTAAAGAIQTKLAINQPGDKYEQEADRVSDQVMRMPAPRLQRACACGGSCPSCLQEQAGHEHEHLQTQRAGPGGGSLDTAPPIVHEVLRSPGRPIDPAIRAFMEPRFGRDFSRVRVHTDARAELSARVVNAHAYTVGNAIVFGHGRFDSQTPDGRRLLGHELTHVVQQASGDAPRAVAREPEDAGVHQEDAPGRTDAASQETNAPKEKDALNASAPKAPVGAKGCAERWGRDTVCSRWGFLTGDSTKGRGKDARPIACCNTRPASVEDYARDSGLDGAASCDSSHQKEVATVSYRRDQQPVSARGWQPQLGTGSATTTKKVLCSDTLSKYGEASSSSACDETLHKPTEMKEVVELSPHAMEALSGANPVKPAPIMFVTDVRYSKFPKLDELCPFDEKNGMSDCVTKGCTVEKSKAPFPRN